MCSSSMEWFPEFVVKFQSPEHTTNRLRIPDAFVKFCNGLMPKSANLITSTGKVWPVDVTSIGHRVCFTIGWDKFVSVNNVECEDTLVFRYDGDGKFGVKMFGEDGLEKWVGAPNISGVRLKEEVEAEEEAAGKMKGKRRQKTSRKDYGGLKKNGAEILEETFTVKERGKAIRTNMYVPVKIARALSLSGPVIYLNKDGQQWKGTAFKAKKREENFISGWERFCIHNNVRAEDLCLCKISKSSEEAIATVMVKVVPPCDPKLPKEELSESSED